jgi:hypothetical protein
VRTSTAAQLNALHWVSAIVGSKKKFISFRLHFDYRSKLLQEYLDQSSNHHYSLNFEVLRAPAAA